MLMAGEPAFCTCSSPSGQGGKYTVSGRCTVHTMLQPEGMYVIQQALGPRACGCSTKEAARVGYDAAGKSPHLHEGTLDCSIRTS